MARKNVMDIVDSAQSGRKPFHERAGMTREEVARGRAQLAEERRRDNEARESSGNKSVVEHSRRASESNK